MEGNRLPSLVMNEMNSLTHSCMHSFASFAILAFSGNAVFMIRATGAKLRISVSDSNCGSVDFSVSAGMSAGIVGTARFCDGGRGRREKRGSGGAWEG